MLNSLYHKVSIRGFVIVGDYHDWPPCKRAVDEFRARNSIFDPIQEIDWQGSILEEILLKGSPRYTLSLQKDPARVRYRPRLSHLPPE